MDKNEFLKHCEMSTEENACSGRPKKPVTDESIKKVQKIIFDNRKVKLIEITETLKISKERFGHIVHDQIIFGYEKALFKVGAARAHNREEKMLVGRKFCSDEEVIAETEAYFEAKDKSY